MRGLCAKRESAFGVSRQEVSIINLTNSHLLLLLLWTSLGSWLEVAVDERRHVVFIISTSGASLASTTLFINDVLQESILLRANLLEDTWEHLLHRLRLRLSHHGQQVLAHREHNCTSQTACQNERSRWVKRNYFSGHNTYQWVFGSGPPSYRLWTCSLLLCHSEAARLFTQTKQTQR